MRRQNKIHFPLSTTIPHTDIAVGGSRHQHRVVTAQGYAAHEVAVCICDGPRATTILQQGKDSNSNELICGNSYRPSNRWLGWTCHQSSWWEICRRDERAIRAPSSRGSGSSGDTALAAHPTPWCCGPYCPRPGSCNQNPNTKADHYPRIIVKIQHGKHAVWIWGRTT